MAGLSFRTLVDAAANEGWRFATESVFRTPGQRVVLGVGVAALSAFTNLATVAVLAAGYGAYCWDSNRSALNEQAALEECDQRINALGNLPPKTLAPLNRSVEPLQIKFPPPGEQSMETGCFGSAISFALYTAKENIVPVLQNALEENLLLKSGTKLEEIRDQLKPTNKAVALHRIGQILRGNGQVAQTQRELLEDLLTLKEGGFPKELNETHANRLIFLLQLYEAASSQTISTNQFKILHEALRGVDSKISERIEEVDPEKALISILTLLKKQDISIQGSEESIVQVHPATGVKYKKVIKSRNRNDNDIQERCGGFQLKAVLIQPENTEHATFIFKNGNNWVLLDNNSPHQQQKKYRSLSEAIKETGWIENGSVFYYEK